MIIEKEFYFLRHGQTDHNAGQKPGDLSDIALNGYGKQQVIAIKNYIQQLPLQSICFSPLLRARQTQDILFNESSLPKYAIPQLTECSLDVWEQLLDLEKGIISSNHTSVQPFLQQAQKALEIILSKESPTLVIAHGGVHLVLCYITNAQHDWKLDNCALAHFFTDETGHWKTKKLV